MVRKNAKVQLIRQEEIYSLAFRLGLQVKKADFRPEVIVAIARGGFVPARYLCDFLDIYTLAGFRIKHYEAGMEQEEEAVIEYPLSIDIRGKRVLLVDDINDSGETLKLACEHLQSFHPAELKTAVLHEKTTTAFASDFVQEKIRQWRWVTYPWARVEDIAELSRDLLPRANSLEELRNLLNARHDMGVSIEQLQIIEELGRIGR